MYVYVYIYMHTYIHATHETDRLRHYNYYTYIDVCARNVIGGIHDSRIPYCAS
jgi:hypothetical protein